MKSILKYELQIADENRIYMPEGSKLLSIEVKLGVPFLYALVPAQYRGNYKFRIFHTYATGTEENIDGIYIGTYQLLEGRAVYHVFEEGNI